MNAAEQEKPTIVGYIRPYHIGYCYAEEHKSFFSAVSNLEKLHSDRRIPFVAVRVFYSNGEYPIEYDWTTSEPKKIEKYRKKRWEDSSQLTFPAFVPLSLLCNKKEGDVLQVVVHGYPAQLTCTSLTPKLPRIANMTPGNGLGFRYDATCITEQNNFNTLLNQTNQYFQQKKSFKQNEIFQYIGSKKDIQDLIDNQILEPTDEKNTFKRGRNGFTSITECVIPLVMNCNDQNCIQSILLLMKIVRFFETSY